MTRTAYLLSMMLLLAAFAAWTLLWGDEIVDNPVLNIVSFAVLLGGGATLTMVWKRSQQKRTRSRDEDSIERKASEKASETAFSVAAVMLAALMLCLTFAWGFLGFLLGAGAIAVAVASFWIAYSVALRRMTTDAK